MAESPAADEYGFSAADEADLLKLAEAEDEYDLSSGDEAELLNLADAVESSNSNQGHKRRASSEQKSLITKKQATDTSQKVFQSAVIALNSKFGFKSFRLKQQQAISRILGGKSAVVVFPTGGGKSLCFQVPAIVFEEEDKLLNSRKKGEHGGK